MKTIWQPVLIIISFVFGCFCGSCSSIDDNSKQNIKDWEVFAITDPGNLSDGVILGERIKDPYSFSNMEKAYQLLSMTRSNPDTTNHFGPNYLYIRCHPTDSTHIDWLFDSGYDFFNIPLDYEIIGDPDEYYDPTLPPGGVSWQYLVIPIDASLPPMDYEILDYCYIPDDDIIRSYNTQ